MASGLNAGHGWWLVLAVIAAWEVACSEGEMLSHGFDRLLEKHPWWPRIAVLAVAFHLINWMPHRFDPVAALFGITRASRGFNRATLQFPRVRQKA